MSVLRASSCAGAHASLRPEQSVSERCRGLSTPSGRAARGSGARTGTAPHAGRDAPHVVPREREKQTGACVRARGSSTPCLVLFWFCYLIYLPAMEHGTSRQCFPTWLDPNLGGSQCIDVDMRALRFWRETWREKALTLL